jgi:CheY-like chemotaxis protein
MLDAQHFNLLLLDLRMPQMDGFQVLAIVRRKFPSLRVVVMTAVEDEQFRARSYAMGIDLYIEKPKTGKEIINFVDCIESLLEREDTGGFRGVQSKTLVDLIQLECLTQSSAILKSHGHRRRTHLGPKGEIIDAASGDLWARMPSSKCCAGTLKFCRPTPRPRTIFSLGEPAHGNRADARRVRARAPGRRRQGCRLLALQGRAVRVASRGDGEV